MSQPTPLSAMTVLAALSLAACQSPFNGRDDALTAESMHPIAVDTRMVSAPFDVPVEAFTLSAEDHDKAEGLIADYRSRGFGKLSITTPTGTPNAAVSLQIAAEMTEIARNVGVEPKRIEIAGYRATASEAAPPLVVSYMVYEATPTPCGNFNRNLATAPLNLATPDHGCATQNNLAAMVENPKDLIAPRGEGPADLGRRRTTLDKYRQGAVTGSEKTDAGSGTVSEVKQ